MMIFDCHHAVEKVGGLLQFESLRTDARSTGQFLREEVEINQIRNILPLMCSSLVPAS